MQLGCIIFWRTLCRPSLFRSLGLATQLEPANLLTEKGNDNRRPDIKIQNSFDEGRQIILYLAVAGIDVDGQSRRSDANVLGPLNSRFAEKLRKYVGGAERTHKK